MRRLLRDLDEETIAFADDGKDDRAPFELVPALIGVQDRGREATTFFSLGISTSWPKRRPGQARR